MPGIDNSHQHVSSDIMQVDNPHTPISGAQTIRLEPVEIAFDTPGLNNPSDLGPELFTVAAGTFFRIIVIVSESWDRPGQMQINAGEGSASSNMVSIATYDVSNFYASNVLEWVNREANPASGITNISAWALAVQECKVCAAFYPDNIDPAAGSATVLLMTAEST